MTDIVKVLQNAMVADTALAGIFDERVYPVQLPDAATFPAVVITKVSAVDNQDMDGDTLLDSSRVQVDVYAEGYDDMLEGKAAICDFMVARPPPGPPCVINRASCINDMDLPAPKRERAGPGFAGE